MAGVHGPTPTKTEFTMDFNDLDRELAKVPLFMSHLPDEDNITLEAIQSLVYDGTPEEIAENFKNQGNDCFKGGKAHYKNAVDYYTKAIDTQCSDMKLIEACYANRAAVNLEMGNLGRAIRDCAKCLELNPRNVKALYRSARALLSLERLDEAYDCCEHALLVDPTNAPVMGLREQCGQRRAVAAKQQQEKEEREQKAKKTKEDLEKALTQRKISIVVTDKEVHANAKIVYDAEQDVVSWPVFFLYPEHKESDFLESCHEDSTFMDHLEVIFEQPAPWDASHSYVPEDLDVYFENTQSSKPKLIKIGKKHTLRKILSLEQYVVANGIPSFIILPKQSSFTETFLQKYR
ncbi:hypothetical protein BDF14DRAFT_1738274 [Spinellus fusiger]|nr:hypothetical protein BDF14DRAFT_1738274 [Spinellus fusiger]